MKTTSTQLSQNTALGCVDIARLGIVSAVHDRDGWLSRSRGLQVRGLLTTPRCLRLLRSMKISRGYVDNA
jgi:hypothetical protein